MPDDLKQIILGSKAWRKLESAVRLGKSPRSVSVVIASAAQCLFAEMYGKMLLGDGTAWRDSAHPDMISAGKYLVPPTIGECRALLGELSLKPVAAPLRLAVIWCADKLSAEVSNSLLKLTEEPPEHGAVLYISEEDRLIPTLRSRLWCVRIELPKSLTSSRRPPSSSEEWADWIEGGKDFESESVYQDLESWIRYFSEIGDFIKAAELESLMRLTREKQLSVPMIQDILFAVLKEGIPCGEIFGDLW